MDKIGRAHRRGVAGDLIVAVVLIGACLATFLACSGGGKGTSPTPQAQADEAPGSLMAIDPHKRLAWVPIGRPDPATNNARIVVLNLAADPDKTNPLVGTIVLPNSAGVPAEGTAIDLQDHLVFATTGQWIAVNGANENVPGNVYLIDEDSNTVTAVVPFPATNEAGQTGHLWFDEAHHNLIVAACDSSSTFGSQGIPCSGTSGSAQTGFTIFDPASKTFGPVIPTNYSEYFGFDATPDILVNASDSDAAGQIGVIDLTHSAACTLSDSNLHGDNDSAALDPATAIAVVSNEDGTAAVLNLNSGTFSGEGSPSCTFTEAGTTPNSVLVTGLPILEGGYANPNTHQVFLRSRGESSGVALITLPANPVAQLGAGDVSTVSATMPNDPSNSPWTRYQLNRRLELAGRGMSPQNGVVKVDWWGGGLIPVTLQTPTPIQVAGGTDTLNDIAYVANFAETFVAGIDLAKFQSNPADITTPLPPGNCAGTTTTLACSNGHGVTFFPLPQ